MINKSINFSINYLWLRYNFSSNILNENIFYKHEVILQIISNSNGFSLLDYKNIAIIYVNTLVLLIEYNLTLIWAKSKSKF